MSFDNLTGDILSIYQCVCKISSQYSTQFKTRAISWVHLVNMNVYAKFHHNIPLSSRDSVLRIKVRLPVLLCAVKTVEDDFRFCWTVTPNVGQTHKENPNLVRILYMVLYGTIWGLIVSVPDHCLSFYFTLNDIYKQYNKLHEH